MMANKNGYCQKGMEGKHHLGFFDNFFNSVQLLEDLKTKMIHACGTVNPNRRLLPNFKPDRMMKRGDCQIFTSDTRIIAFKWRDKRSVYLFSNYHNPGEMSQVDRKNRDGSVEGVPCPTALIDYNKNMNFVDKFDQNLNVYKIDRKSKKWWHRIFFIYWMLLWSTPSFFTKN